MTQWLRRNAESAANIFVVNATTPAQVWRPGGDSMHLSLHHLQPRGWLGDWKLIFCFTFCDDCDELCEGL